MNSPVSPIVPDSIAQVREKLREHNQETVAGNHASRNLAKIEHGNPRLIAGYESDRSFQTLNLNQIKAFDKNPRRTLNPRYAEIKESVRQSRGLNQALTVTKRPGEQVFTLAAGGNTRLSVLQELWSETQESCYFEAIPCFYIAYPGEAALIGNHLTENEVKGDVSFIDTAFGIQNMRAELEKETGNKVVLLDLEANLRNRGLQVSKSSLSVMQFATNYLPMLGNATRLMGHRDVANVLHPGFNRLKRIYSAVGIKLVDDYQTALAGVSRELGEEFEQTGEFDANRVVTAWEAASASYLNKSLDNIKAAKKLLDTKSSASDMELAAILDATNLQLGKTTGNTSINPKSPVNRQISIENEAYSTSQSLATESRLPETSQDSLAHSSTLTTPVSAIAAMQMVHESASNLAKACQIDDVFVSLALAPMGYFMELPESPLSDRTNNPTNAYCGWWLLQELSLQNNPNNWDKLPKDSRWYLAKSNMNGDEKLSHLSEEVLGPAMDVEMLNAWLNMTDQTIFNLYVEFRRALRMLGSIEPKRFMSENGE